MIVGFLLGFITASSFVAAVCFLRFWKETRDFFFLAFAASFFLQAFTFAATTFLPKPNEGSPSTYVIRLFSFLLILAAVWNKNYGRQRPRDILRKATGTREAGRSLS